MIPFKDGSSQALKSKGRRALLVVTHGNTGAAGSGNDSNNSSSNIPAGVINTYFKATPNQQRRRSSALSIMLQKDSPLARKLKMQAMAVAEELLSPVPTMNDKLDIFKILIINELLMMNDLLRAI